MTKPGLMGGGQRGPRPRAPNGIIVGPWSEAYYYIFWGEIINANDIIKEFAFQKARKNYLFK